MISYKKETQILKEELKEQEKILKWLTERFIHHTHAELSEREDTLIGSGLYSIELKNMLSEKKEKMEKLKKRLNVR